MDIVFDEATKEDIKDLIKLRIAYMIDDFGKVSDSEKECMQNQLADYFNRKLGNELIAFTARDGGRIVAVVYLHIIEMPASLAALNGLYGEALNVYTEPAYRRRGLCTALMKNLLDYGKKIGLDRIDLSATKKGYPLYVKIGFAEKEQRYTDMRYKYKS